MKRRLRRLLGISWSRGLWMSGGGFESVLMCLGVMRRGLGKLVMNLKRW